MGCAVSCVHQTTMALFGKHSSTNSSDTRAKLERKLYLAKESPESDFDLSECELRRVPSGIYSICKVYRKEHLHLHKNHLESLDNGGHLSDLYLIKVLNLSYNIFSKIPDDIRHLISLNELYIQGNLIKEIPESIECLQNLQILDISNNRLTRLTPAVGKLKSLRKLNITENKGLNQLCPELCYVTNIIQIHLDGEQFVFPPSEVATQGTTEIMKFLCNVMDVDYCPPEPFESEVPVQSPNLVIDPFTRRSSITWEEHEAAIIEQENKIHEAAKQQREKFLSKILQEQLELDSEIAKIQEVKDADRQRLIKAIQDDEREIECLVKNFIQSENLKPEVVQQQLAHEQAEHDRILEITRQNYDNIRKADILKAMATLIEEDYVLQYSKKHYEDSFNSVKESMLMQELEGAEKLHDLLKAKDDSRSILVQQLLEDQDIQKAVVASLVERVDARSWSLNEEISLISSHLARLSVIEQEKKKLQVAYNYNELLHQRTQLVNLLDDLLDQQSLRRKQLIDTLKEMESQTDKTTDFWLKNYQKLLDSAPKSLLNIGKHLDPVFANYLLQEGVIHCLPFLVKFIFSGESLLNVTLEGLKENGVLLSSDREGIIRAIDNYVGAKNQNFEETENVTLQPTAPTDIAETELPYSGVVNIVEGGTSMESECVVCMDSRCEVVFVPCGHMCCCQPCASKDMDCCPMCRGDIERKIKVMIA
ncbi:E3 ubiquitin-protein ligase LRSAM1-like [Pectinophora gossypiella]|uniref:E3 ubiquitin-protein ligase LRSAM1-like n=1 Tax=Pectinophora gossypiella TaxID=13191 RepID=UPI00214E3966|nr:E3 ubiquitin-protein ligase LRSAM1-like [Pectinophora gossypiella]